MKKLILAISLVVGLCVATSCGDPGDNGSMYNWKDVWYAFDMVEEETSLKGLQVEITYLDPLSIERRYNYSKFGQWDTIFHHLPWEFIPRMKATVIQPEDVEFTESDFPAVIHIRMGISDGYNIPQRLDKTETFETLSEFNKYITNMEYKTYKVYPSTTEITK